MGRKLGYYQAKNVSKMLLKAATGYESELEHWICESGIHYVRQKPIFYEDKLYVVDFLLDGKLIVEVDGSSHDKEDKKEYDALRTQRLESLGYKVIRITNKEVINGNPLKLLKKRAGKEFKHLFKSDEADGEIYDPFGSVCTKFDFF